MYLANCALHSWFVSRSSPCGSVIYGLYLYWLVSLGGFQGGASSASRMFTVLHRMPALLLPVHVPKHCIPKPHVLKTVHVEASVGTNVLPATEIGELAQQTGKVSVVFTRIRQKKVSSADFNPKVGFHGMSNSR